jgi:hypothetical protein
MYSKVVSHILKNTRPQFFGLALVAIYGGTYLAGYYAFQYLSRSVGWNIEINFYLLNIFIGCVGAGEIGRGLYKISLPEEKILHTLGSTALAGAICIGVFWALMVLKWSHYNFTSIPLAMLAGAAFYLVIFLAFKLEKK